MSIRKWLLKFLAAGRPVAMNLNLVRGLYIDSSKSKGGFYYRVNIDRVDDELPDDVGFYFYAPQKGIICHKCEVFPL